MALTDTLEQVRKRIVGTRPPFTPWRERMAEEAYATSQRLLKAGWVERDWRPSKNSPAAYYHEGGFWDWDELTKGWLDHPYRLVNKEQGLTLYVSEPYGLTGVSKPLSDTGTRMVRVDFIFRGNAHARLDNFCNV